MIAKSEQFEEVYGILMQYKDIFTYLRQDQVKRRIEAGEVYLKDGVVIIFCKYKHKVKIGTCQALRGTIIFTKWLTKIRETARQLRLLWSS